MTGRREQIRATTLAAIMVLSVVAIGGVGLAGSAVAQEEDPGGEDGPDAIVYDFTIDGDGGPYTLGVPGPVVGTVDEMIDGDLGDEGAVYAYDAETGWQSVEGDSELEALDAVTILPGEENASDEIGIEVALEAGASPTETALDEGWNFVSANQFSDAEQAFGQWTDGNMVLDRFEGAQAFDVETVDAGSDTYAGADPFDVSAFEGYFVYTNSDDDGIPTAMSDVQSKDDVVDQLGMSEPAVSIETFDLSLEGESIVTEGSAAAALGLEPVVSVEASSENGMEGAVTEDATIESDDEDIATVEDGVVTTHTEGTTTISAEYLGASASVELTVTEPEVVDRTIDLRDELSVEDAQTGTVTATFTDDSTEDVTDQFSISSDDEAVASVTEEDESFVVSGEATGTANITASEDGGDVVVEHEVTVSDAEIDVGASDATGGAGYATTVEFDAESLLGDEEEVPVAEYTIALSHEGAELGAVDGANFQTEEAGLSVVSGTTDEDGATTPQNLFEAEFLIDEGATDTIDVEILSEQSDVIETFNIFTPVHALPSWTDGSIEVVDVDTGTVEGTITDDDTDAPIEGATVETEYWSTTTDENGEYSLELEPGEYTLDVSHESYPDESVDVTVEAGETANGDLSIVPLDFQAYVQGQEGYLDTNAADDEIEPIEFTETEDFEPTQDAKDAEPEYLPEPEPILMEGVIDEENGTWEGDIDFPVSISETHNDLLGELYTSAEIVATDGAEGTIDQETGEMTLDTEVDININIYAPENGWGTPWEDRGDPVNEDGCHIPSVDLSSTTGDSGSLSGEPLDGEDTATLVGNEFSIDGAEGCGGLFNGAVNDAQGIPTDAGDAEVLFDFAFEFMEPTAPANYDVTIDTDTSDSEVEQGSELSVSATVENTGDVDGEQQSISMDFGGETGVASEDVTLPAGESQDVTLTHTVPAEATAESTSVTVSGEDDTDSYDVTVVEPAPSATISDAGSVTEGETAVNGIDVSFENTDEVTVDLENDAGESLTGTDGETTVSSTDGTTSLDLSEAAASGETINVVVYDTTAMDGDSLASSEVTINEPEPQVSTVDATAGTTELAAGGGETSTVTATVTDGSGNSMEGEEVTFAVDTGEGSLDSTTATTDDQGEATATYTSDAADDDSQVVISATAGDSVSDTATIDVVAATSATIGTVQEVQDGDSEVTVDSVDFTNVDGDSVFVDLEADDGTSLTAQDGEVEVTNSGDSATPTLGTAAAEGDSINVVVYENSDLTGELASSSITVQSAA